jgi:saccharopine dehydrogenase-like NADP-dependent oxidoreductase
LWQEYTRPARIIKDHAVHTIEPTWGPGNVSELEFVIGNEPPKQMEAFVSDGLRSLLGLHWRIKNMAEYTVRWPGHMAFVGRLLDDPKTHGQKEFIKAFRKELGNEHIEDLVVSQILVNGKSCFTLKDTPKNGVTSMARCTGYTCASFARMILQQEVDREKSSLLRGVITPELVGMNNAAYNSIITSLKGKDIEIFSKTR